MQREDIYQDAAARYGEALERLVRAYEANPDKQRDLLQEIHLAMWESFVRYEGRCSLRTWVYRVAHNTAISHVLREKRTNTWVGLEDIEAVPDRGPAHSDADRGLVLDRLLELIRRLRPPDRQLMSLYLEEMSAEGIGEILGISPGNVRVRVHRVKRILTRRFGGGLGHE
jgi:RNA polymerase sigma-70 factor (ECF subfamily)